ncbi:hypothetical protein GW7_00632 [Heterocephalus glaber]|uniref:Uncharacterized protein n=1 Tax=Heterocephalus glaber TaxID=10181 RepID=G5BEV8_HETGA|nr:hypothetical protein GW7_00632 [Heterocephalus glaber]
MKKQKQHGIVYDPKQVVIPSLNVASCCHLLKAKYRPQKAYKTGLVCPQPISAMTGSPDHSPVFQPKENGVGQNHHQEEIVRKLAMQLRRIGDGIHRRTVQERKCQLCFPPPRESLRPAGLHAFAFHSLLREYVENRRLPGRCLSVGGSELCDASMPCGEAQGVTGSPGPQRSCKDAPRPCFQQWGRASSSNQGPHRAHLPPHFHTISAAAAAGAFPALLRL